MIMNSYKTMKTFSEMPIKKVGEEFYKPYSCASIKDAEIHKNATSTGVPKEDTTKICRCCGKHQNERKFKMCENLDSFLIYGCTYSQAFVFIKFMIICLFGSFLLNFGITFFKHKIIWKCTVLKCEKKEFLQSYEENFYWLRVPAFLTIFFFIVAKTVFIILLQKYNKKLKEKTHSLDNYTILVEKLDKNWDEEEIKKKLKEISHVKFEIKKINLIYDISQYVAKIKDFIKLELKLFKPYLKNSQNK
jgi:hypothetical protein